MNGRHNGVQQQGGDQSALSLLVNAADNHDPPRGSNGEGGGSIPNRGLAEALRLRGLSDHGPSLEEQLLLQQQAQGGFGGAGVTGGNLGLLSQLREQNLLSQLGGGGGGGGQNQHLASLLGLGGGGSSLPASDMRSALAAAQLRQQPSLRLQHSDLLALSRGGGGIGGLSGLLGGAGGGRGPVGAGFSELESLQRLEQERRHQLLGSASGVSGGLPPGLSGHHQLDTSAGHGSAGMSRDELMERVARSESGRVPPSNPSPKIRSVSHPGDPTDGSTDLNKEEIEKAPGSVIVPCRARGMPMDHNFKTAYFVIPENVKHGEELICSYFACRNAGIKFRYCSHCKVPVAKRNFRKRHKHGGNPGGIDIGGDDSGAEDDYPGSKKGIPAQIMAKHQEAVEDADGLSSQSTVSNGEVEKGLVRNSMRNLEKDASHPSPKAKSGDISESRQERWAQLLGKRPATKDGDSMSAWLMEVLAVSDLDTPLKDKASAEPVAKSASAVPQQVSTQNETVAPSPPTKSEEKEGGTTSNEPREPAQAPKEEKPVMGAFNGAIVKKKRPLENVTDDESATPSSEQFVSGSFAEWKERKRLKHQGKPEEAEEEP